MNSTEEKLARFPAQFEWEPEIKNGPLEQDFENLVVLGMGGSHLAADLLRITNPTRSLTIWSDYGLPPLVPEHSVIIASSYSGNTEEVINGLEEAIQQSLSCIIVTTGGKLLEMAQSKRLPFIQLPQTNIEPRRATGYSFRALLKILGDEEALSQTKNLAQTLNVSLAKQEGWALAEKIGEHIPLIYASKKNEPIAYNWKIKFNENAKIPAFMNVLPELNHNEMAGFDAPKQLIEAFSIILLRDDNDSARIQKRMNTLEKILTERNIETTIINLPGENIYQKIFQNLLLADFATCHHALNHHIDPEKVPIIEEFKKEMV